jgi:hypothetical protein
MSEMLELHAAQSRGLVQKFRSEFAVRHSEIRKAELRLAVKIGALKADIARNRVVASAPGGLIHQYRSGRRDVRRGKTARALKEI